MKKLSAEIKVGLFILIGFTSLLYMAFKIGTITLWQEEGRNYFHIYFNSISGVVQKSKVRMQGVMIGEVGEIALEKRKVKITVLLDRPIDIPVDSVATFESAGLLGDKFVNILPGVSDEYIKNDGYLENTIEPVSIDEIMTKLSSTLDDVKRFSKGLGDLFGDDGTIEGVGGQLGSIMDNVERATALLRIILEENRVNIREGISNVRSVSGNLNQMIAENRENFKDTMANLRKGSEKLDEVMVSIRNVAGKIERGEGTIGKLVQDEDVYENINTTLLSAQGFLGQVQKIKIGLGLRAEYQSELNKTKSYFSLRIKPREDKYYLLEISEDTRREDIDARNALNSLLYTILITKRYGDVRLKGGIIESSGGVGLDFYAWRDALRFTADVFNFSGYDANAENPQLKITGRFFFQKYVFLYMGGDELLNEYYRTFFAGLGMMVDEDDLKFFFGLLS